MVFDLINLTLALAGLGLAVLSLVLQRRQCRESGSVVDTELNLVIVGDRDPPTEGISVTARNKGRLGVTVTAWGAELPNGASYVYWSPLPGNPSLPHRLEPGDEARWWMPLDALKKGLAEQGLGESKVAMYVGLGTGERLVTNNNMTVAPAQPGGAGSET